MNNVADPVLECSQVVLRFFRALDEDDLQALLGLVAEDGVWTRQGVDLAGHQAIRDAFAARPADRTVLHVISNLIVDVAGPDSACVAGYMTVYAAPRQKGAGVAPAAAPRLVAVMNTDLRKVPGGWRITRQRSRPVFRAA